MNSDSPKATMNTPELTMKSPSHTRTLVQSACCALALASSALGGTDPVVSGPDDLPPVGGPGWYSAPGQTVSFYVEYGTNQGLSSEFKGVFLEAHDMIVDNFQNVTRSYTNNDERIRFDAQLTASVTTFGGLVPRNPMLVTLAGSMQVRLANRLGHPTGTFPLTVEALSFTLTDADIGGNTNTPVIGIRSSPTIPSTGQLSVKALQGGGYEVSSTLYVYSETSMYAGNGNWLPWWPDTNAPTTYTLRALKPPVLSYFTVASTPPKDVYLSFPMRRYVRHVLEYSTNLTNWTPLLTNQWTTMGDSFRHTHFGGGNGPKGFYLIQSSLQPPL
jgi:hypothetical protein